MRVALVVALLATAGMKAHAIYQETQLTPKVLDDAWASYTIQTRVVNAVTEFEVSVRALPGRKLSPARRALLELADGHSIIASIPVEEKLSGTKLTFWFRVAAKLVADGKFSFGQNSYAKSKDGTVVGLPGGSGAYFYLRDFASRRNISRR